MKERAQKPTRHASGERAAKAAAALVRDAAAPVTDFDPVPVRIRRDGRTAGRQRTFLTVLSGSGLISLACQVADAPPCAPVRPSARLAVTRARSATRPLSRIPVTC